MTSFPPRDGELSVVSITLPPGFDSIIACVEDAPEEIDDEIRHAFLTGLLFSWLRGIGAEQIAAEFKRLNVQEFQQ